MERLSPLAIRALSLCSQAGWAAALLSLCLETAAPFGLIQHPPPPHPNPSGMWQTLDFCGAGDLARVRSHGELCGFYLQMQVGISIGGPCAVLNKANDRVVVGGIMPKTCHISGSSKGSSWNAEAGSGGDVLCIKVPQWDWWEAGLTEY